MIELSYPKSFPGDHSEWVPPDPLPNSEVKLLSADGSVGSPHVRVGHRQALKYESPRRKTGAFLLCAISVNCLDRLQ